MKILILANDDVGLYNFRKELIEQFLNDQNTVYIALPGGEKVIKLMQMGCIFLQTDVDRRGMNPAKDLRLLREYYKIIKKKQPDIVCTYTIKPNIYGGIACQILHKKYIVNITGLGSAIVNGRFLSGMLMALYRLALKKAEMVFFQNKNNMNIMIEKKVVKGQIGLLPGSGVNLKFHSFEEYPPNTGKITILFLGRVMKDKGIEELLNAASYVKNMYPNVTFRIAGSCEENYSELLSMMEQQRIIEYIGVQDNVHAAIKESHAVLLPSYHEGMSNVLLESAACGRPLLASRIPGCQEIIDEGITGYCFEPKNVQDLEKVVEKFLILPYEDKMKMGIMARKKVENEFDRKIIIDAYTKEISKLKSEECQHEPV